MGSALLLSLISSLKVYLYDNLIILNKLLVLYENYCFLIILILLI
jgi:hypothetical protein